MRTFKQNVIELDEGDNITIRYKGVDVHLQAIDTGDDEADHLGITLPAGMVLSNIRLPIGGGWEEVMFAREDVGIMQELHGPADMIAFRPLPPPAEADTPEFSSLTHPNNAGPRLRFPDEGSHLTKSSLIRHLEEYEGDPELVVTLPTGPGDDLMTFYLRDEVLDGWKVSGIAELRLGEFATG